MKHWRDIYSKIPKVCHFLEFLMAMVVLVGFAFAAWHYFVEEGLLFQLLHGEITFNIFLEVVLGLVIGIEFLKMFCAPDSENVLEVLIFMVARHMIVGESTKYEMFVSVLAVCLLCLARVFIHERERKMTSEENNKDSQAKEK